LDKFINYGENTITGGAFRPMDINCTHDCIYQNDGKCHLSCSVTVSHMNNSRITHVDCPYFLSNEDLEQPSQMQDHHS